MRCHYLAQLGFTSSQLSHCCLKIAFSQPDASASQCIFNHYGVAVTVQNGNDLQRRPSVRDGLPLNRCGRTMPIRISEVAKDTSDPLGGGAAIMVHQPSSGLSPCERIFETASSAS